MKEGCRAEGGRYGSMRFMRWISIINFRKCANTMLAQVVHKSFGKPFCFFPIARAYHPKTYFAIQAQQGWTGTTLMISQIPIYLSTLVDSFVLEISWRQSTNAPPGHKFIVHNSHDRFEQFIVNRSVWQCHRPKHVGTYIHILAIIVHIISQISSFWIPKHILEISFYQIPDR